MPSSIVITIAGSNRTSLVVMDTLRYSRVVNGIGTATFTIEDPTGAVIVAPFDTVVVTVGGVNEWTGSVASPDGITLLGAEAGVTYQVSCVDQMQLAQRDVVNTIFPEETLKATLETLTDPSGLLDNLGIGLAAGQVDGDTLTTITAPWMPIDALLQYLSVQSGYVYRIEDDELEMWAIGSRSSGVTLSIDNANYHHVEYGLQQFDYRSGQWLIFGPSQVLTVEDTWTGDGATQEFPQHYDNGATRPDTVTVDGVTSPVGVNGVDSMEWTWRESDHTLVQDGTPIDDGIVITATYDSVFPNEVYTQDDTAMGEVRWVRADAFSAITNYWEALALAERLIAINLPQPQLPKVTTNEEVEPGETVVVDFPEIGLSSVTCFCRGVETVVSAVGSEVTLDHTLDLIGGDELPPTSADALWQRILMGGGGNGLGSGDSGVTVTRRFSSGGGIDLNVYNGETGAPPQALNFVNATLVPATPSLAAVETIGDSGDQLTVSLTNVNTTNTDDALVQLLASTTAGTTSITLGTLDSVVNDPNAIYINADTINASGADLTIGDVTATRVGIGTAPDALLHVVGGQTILGSGAWPTTSVGQSGQRVGILADNESPIVVIGDIQAGVGANRGADLRLGARATNATADLAQVRILGARENATSGNFATYLALSTSTSGATLTEAFRIDSAQRVGIGTSANINHGGVTAFVNIATATSGNRLVGIDYFAADASGPILVLAKSRHGTLGSFTYPSSADSLGQIFFSGANESDARFNVAASILAVAGSTWTSSNQEAYLAFTTTAASSVTRAERLRLHPTGEVGIAAGGWLSMVEITAPSAPAANGVRIYAEDDGGGKTRLMALFSSGAAQQIAIQP